MTTGVFGSALYADSRRGDPRPRSNASLGCGVPTAVADLHDGEIVLDLGSGAGADVLISARRVGPTGRAIGLDMTDEMLDLARANAAEAGVENVEFVKGYLEELPLPDASVDVVISNCVINLSGDKPKVIAEAARVLRPGGRFAVSDVIADPDMDDATRADMAAWTGCIAGALTEAEVPRRARRPPASTRSRSARPTGSTSTPPPRSSAPANPRSHDYRRPNTRAADARGLQPRRVRTGRATRALPPSRPGSDHCRAATRPGSRAIRQRVHSRLAQAHARGGARMLPVRAHRLRGRRPPPHDDRRDPRPGPAARLVVSRHRPGSASNVLRLLCSLEAGHRLRG